MTRERLSDGAGDVNRVEREGDVVTRDTGPWSPAVHRLLRHLEAVGFDGAPRLLGVDGDRERLSFVEGLTPALPWEAWVFTDEALAGLAHLLRRYHDAVASFRWSDDDEWRWWVGRARDGHELVCHSDLWPPNVVFRDGLPFALIDWDFAQPGRRIDDIASAVKHFTPLIASARRAADRWPAPGDEGRRARLFCDEYGLGPAERAQLLDTVLRNNHSGYESHRLWGQAGVPGFKEMWEAGDSQRILADREWLLATWDDLAAALR
jgi:hypothetical protein